MSEGTITEGQTLTGPMFNEPMRAAVTKVSSGGAVTAGLVGLDGLVRNSVTVLCHLVTFTGIIVNRKGFPEGAGPQRTGWGW